jgi:hypothetical protein
VSKATFPIVVKRGSVIVKIYKTPTRGFDAYTACHYQDGKRKRTLLADLQLARTEAETIATRLGNTEADVLTLTSADRAEYLLARKVLDPLRISIAAAANLVAEAVNRLGDVPLGRVVDFYVQRHSRDMQVKTTGDVVEEFLAGKARDGVSEAYRRQLGLGCAGSRRNFRGCWRTCRGRRLMGGCGRRTGRRGRGTTCGRSSKPCSILR